MEPSTQHFQTTTVASVPPAHEEMSSPLRNPSVSSLPHQPFHMRSNNNNPATTHRPPPDEGYSEETRSQSDSDMDYIVENGAPISDVGSEEIFHMAMSFSVEKRKGESAMPSLPRCRYAQLDAPSSILIGIDLHPHATLYVKL